MSCQIMVTMSGIIMDFMKTLLSQVIPVYFSLHPNPEVLLIFLGAL